MAMHDLNLATMYSDKIVMIRKGRVLGDASPKEVITVENIRLLYGIDVSISKEFGTLHVVLNRPQIREDKARRYVATAL